MPILLAQYSEILSAVERLLFFFIPVMAEYLPSELQHAILVNLMYSYIDSVLKDIQRASEEEGMEFEELISEINALTTHN